MYLGGKIGLLGQGPMYSGRVIADRAPVLVTVFWNVHGIIHIDYLGKGKTITA